MRQTAARGDLRGFRRISWDEALDEAAGCYTDLIRRSRLLGYLPVLEKGGISPWIGPHLGIYGNPSNGNLNGAVFAALGAKDTVQASPAKELFKSRHVIVWANDPVVSLPYLSYVLIRAREEGIPFTFIDSRYTQSTNVLGTGKNGLPPLICIRPGTDSALAAAMAFVIFRKGLCDEEFIRKFCFGFYPRDHVKSESTGLDPVTGLPFAGREYEVPRGQSFIEYLEDLERDSGGYEGVLRWASSRTGVAGDIIERLAFEYATSKPAFIFSRYNGGAQRMRNGLYFSWMLIALSAMTGNLAIPGGGFGEVASGDGFEIEYPEPVVAMPFVPIRISRYGISELILTGRDGRSAAHLRSDILAMNGVDIGEEGCLKLNVYVKGGANGNDFNQTQNINRKRAAWARLEKVISYERHFSPTAAWSDLVLPATSTFERTLRLEKHKYAARDVFVLNGPLEAVGEAKTDAEINRLLALRLGVEYPEEDLAYGEAMRGQWQKARVEPRYAAQTGKAIDLPGFEELLQSGICQLPMPPEASLNPYSEMIPGRLTTETGKINFYSPFLAERNRIVSGISRAQHVELDGDGSEAGKAGERNDGAHQHYPLQLITPHGVSRAVATYDNVTSLRAAVPHAMDINPADAEARGIENGDEVYVFNDLGCMKITAHVTASIMQGVISIQQGAWYRASESEMYEASFDADGDGLPESHIVPVDISGSVNVLTEDVDSGIRDPFIDGMGMNANGARCEVSRSLPERKGMHG
jgi:anaerobic dimethyl sulfoxide reductase subunit A